MAVPEPFTGVTSSSPVRHHILSVLVENKAGVLARIAGLFARRGFNIYSLAVAPADDSQRFSRITIVVDAESAPLEQIRGQLDKLINVVEIKDLAPREALERELLLATVEVDDETRQAVLDAVAQANAAIVDVNDTSATLMLAGTPAACDALERQLEAFAQIELHRTGRVALPRLSSEPTRN
ncbi:MAG: acetolactate synthase small subunit [Actinobacteria bacterium]|nr:acetolactate synthase small subunit [Actinomycetota bacterium]